MQKKTPFKKYQERIRTTLDVSRKTAVEKRHAKDYRTARENLYALVDKETFIEYGQMAVAAQRGRKSLNELIEKTPADGVVTGLGLSLIHI